MKKIIYFVLCISLCLCGCGAGIGSADAPAQQILEAAAPTFDNGREAIETSTFGATASDPSSNTLAANANITDDSESESQLRLEAGPQHRPSPIETREMKVHFIDVGQSDCILVELPNSENMLIDAGDNKSEQTVIDYLHANTIEHLNYVFGTHPHEDHIGSLDAVIQSFSIGSLFMPRVTHSTKTFEDVLAAIEKKGLTVKSPKAGELVINDSDIHLYMRVMAPSKDEYVDLNNYSIVLKLAYVDATFLFAGDAEDILEYEMIDSGMDIDVDVLKVGHHGSDTSTSEAFLTATTPEYAIISVGENNNYGHPSQIVVDRLNNAGVEIFLTSELGTIVATTDGKNIDFAFEKEYDESTNAAMNASTTAAPASITTTGQQSDNKSSNSNNRNYIGNKNSKVFHKTTCRSLPKESNRVQFNNRDAAINAGYRPCQICKP